MLSFYVSIGDPDPGSYPCAAASTLMTELSPPAEFLLEISTNFTSLCASCDRELYSWMCDLCSLHYGFWKEHLDLDGSKETFLVSGTRTQAFVRTGILQKRKGIKEKSKNDNTKVTTGKTSGTGSASEDSDLLIFISYSLKAAMMISKEGL